MLLIVPDLTVRQPRRFPARRPAGERLGSRRNGVRGAEVVAQRAKPWRCSGGRSWRRGVVADGWVAVQGRLAAAGGERAVHSVTAAAAAAAASAMADGCSDGGTERLSLPE